MHGLPGTHFPENQNQRKGFNHNLNERFQHLCIQISMAKCHKILYECSIIIKSLSLKNYRLYTNTT